MNIRFQIGTRYVDRRGRECTVTDILRTYNSADELVKVRYVSEHQFMGQTVIDGDVWDATIARALADTWAHHAEQLTKKQGARS